MLGSRFFGVGASAVLTATLLTGACAVMSRGTTQSIPVTSTPTGATVRVDGKERGATPLTLTVPRTPKDQVIRIESPGYELLEIRLKRGHSSRFVTRDMSLGLLLGFLGGAFLNAGTHGDSGINLLIGPAAAMGAFLLIDLASGAAYDLAPVELAVTLTKSQGPPHVEVLEIDAAAARRLKWIRVHLD